jgi:hypothetical protein
LGDAEPYKLAWTDAVRQRFQIRAYAPSPLGRAMHVGERLARPAVRKLRQIYRR